jgi:hypothetical protein
MRNAVLTQWPTAMSVGGVSGLQFHSIPQRKGLGVAAHPSCQQYIANHSTPPPVMFSTSEGHENRGDVLEDVVEQHKSVWVTVRLIIRGPC